MQRRNALLKVALLGTTIAALAACDNSATAPTALRSVQGAASIEGDTLECRSGWVVINGRYVCNGEG